MGFCTRERRSHKGVNDPRVKHVKHGPALEMKASLSRAPAATCRASTRGAWCGAVVYTHSDSGQVSGQGLCPQQSWGRHGATLYTCSGPGALPEGQEDPTCPRTPCSFGQPHPSPVPAQDLSEGCPRVPGTHGRECQAHQRFPATPWCPEVRGQPLRASRDKMASKEHRLQWGDRPSEARE